MNAKPIMAGLARIAVVAGSALAFSLLAASGAAAVDVLIPSMGNTAARNDAGDLRALENRIQRQQYQQRQQQFRQEDRLSIPLQPRSPQVQVIRPGCQVQVYGSGRIVRGCR